MNDIQIVHSRDLDGAGKWRWQCAECLSLGEWQYQSPGVSLGLSKRHKCGECPTCHVTPCCCDSASTVFPEELVGRPTSEVLKFLAERMDEYAAETDGHAPHDGYMYAAGWMSNWAEAASRVESTRCGGCLRCLGRPSMSDVVYEGWKCTKCTHSLLEH